MLVLNLLVSSDYIFIIIIKIRADHRGKVFFNYRLELG
jgi:hypothetical protein